jgi:hypothetical protein
MSCHTVALREFDALLCSPRLVTVRSSALLHHSWQFEHIVSCTVEKLFKTIISFPEELRFCEFLFTVRKEGG